MCLSVLLGCESWLFAFGLVLYEGIKSVRLTMREREREREGEMCEI